MAHASQTMRAGWTAVALGCCIAALSADAGVVGLPCDDFPIETLSFSGGLQVSTVPLDADQVEIRAIGAGGGFSFVADPPGDPLPLPIAGGGGRVLRASFPVTPGEVLSVLVGGRGEDASAPANTGGGGGGTFVYRTATLAGLLLAAGGGGSGTGVAAPNKSGSATTTAFAGSGTSPGVAGTGGNGGAGSVNVAGGAGGGGLLTAGGNGGSGATGGASVVAGAAGGTGCCSGSAGDGGFGGGGGGGSTGGAGGGGFNGGGGGGADGDGGGGSSFLSAAGTSLTPDIAATGPNDGIVLLCYSGTTSQPVSEIPVLTPSSLAILAVFLVAAATLLLRRAQR